MGDRGRYSRRDMFLGRFLRGMAEGVAEELHRGADLGLDEPAHLHDAGGNAGQLAVELAGKMFVAHGNSLL